MSRQVLVFLLVSLDESMKKRQLVNLKCLVLARTLINFADSKIQAFVPNFHSIIHPELLHS